MAVRYRSTGLAREQPEQGCPWGGRAGSQGWAQRDSVLAHHSTAQSGRGWAGPAEPGAANESIGSPRHGPRWTRSRSRPGSPGWGLQRQGTGLETTSHTVAREETDSPQLSWNGGPTPLGRSPRRGWSVMAYRPLRAREGNGISRGRSRPAGYSDCILNL